MQECVKNVKYVEALDVNFFFVKLILIFIQIFDAIHDKKFDNSDLK